MNTKENYSPITLKEVAKVLDLKTDGSFSKEQWAQELLDGVTKLTRKELKQLADFKKMTVDELTEADEQLKIYRNPATEAKKEVALKMLLKGFDTEVAAELTELPIDMIKKLKI